MHVVFADDANRDHLLPFTFTRPVSEMRVGILTTRRKWELHLNLPENSSGYLTRFYLSGRYPLFRAQSPRDGQALIINGALQPEDSLVKLIQQLKPGQQLCWNNKLLAAVITLDTLEGKEMVSPLPDLETIHYLGQPLFLQHIWEIFALNDQAIRSDYTLLTKGRKSEVLSSSNQTIRPDQIFVEAGAVIECSILNASAGPIYIGKNAEVMEGCMVRGPFALGADSILKMGAKVYGATTIGPGSKVGGEVSNSVIFGNSNKAHDGFLGNSVIGEWCNLGADTNNSNLKNNYSAVRIWDYSIENYIDTGLQFCGLFMGDHSKCGINTMFNTGTVAGVFANIFGAGFPSKHIPSFSWGGGAESEVFVLDKALALAQKVMERRKVEFTDADRNILSHLYLMHLKPAPTE